MGPIGTRRRIAARSVSSARSSSRPSACAHSRALMAVRPTRRDANSHAKLFVIKIRPLPGSVAVASGAPSNPPSEATLKIAGPRGNAAPHRSASRKIHGNDNVAVCRKGIDQSAANPACSACNDGGCLLASWISFSCSGVCDLTLKEPDDSKLAPRPGKEEFGTS